MQETQQSNLQGLKRANRIAARYDHVSYMQALCMVLCAQSGATLLILPSVIGGGYGTGGWLLLILAAVLSAISCLLIAAAYQKTGAGNLEQLFYAAFGKIAGTVFAALFRFYSIMRASLSVGVFCCAVKGLMIPHVPLRAIAFAVCITLFIIIRVELTAIARLSEISAFFLAGALALMMTCLPSMHSAHLMPLVAPFGKPVSDWLAIALFCASGPEIALYFYSYLERVRPRMLLYGVGLGMSVKLYLVFCACAVFGIYAVSYYTWPVITMFKANNVVGLDRPELMLMMFFTVISLAPAYLFTSFAVRIPKKDDKHPIALSLAAVIAVYALCMQIGDVADIPCIMRALGVCYAFFGLLLPLLLWILGRKCK